MHIMNNVRSIQR